MVEKRAEEVKKQWKKRLQNIEGKYGDETKPFEEYYKSNYGGGMMPITFGRYGEINGEGMDLVKELAKEVVKRVRTDEINLPKIKDKEKAIIRTNVTLYRLHSNISNGENEAGKKKDATENGKGSERSSRDVQSCEK